eukprot:Phypoly_transcript_20362.p1 GENE.Phypoly_transcript_20362~~Phypoly_transcript_20362.p1  ORF type:complete len:216 (+),score=28.11 Phypoly_transcript_20362:35-682(+)
MGVSKKRWQAGTFITLQVLAVVLLSIALLPSVFWYHVDFYDESFTMWKITYFNTKGFCYKLGISPPDCWRYSELEGDEIPHHVVSILDASYSIVILGLISSVVAVGLTIAQLALVDVSGTRKKVIKICTIGFSVSCIILDTLSFGLFFRMPLGYRKDFECELGRSPCTSFMQRTDDESWGPGTGFWLVVASTLVCTVAAVANIKSNKRAGYSAIQ